MNKLFIFIFDLNVLSASFLKRFRALSKKESVQSGLPLHSHRWRLKAFNSWSEMHNQAETKQILAPKTTDGSTVVSVFILVTAYHGFKYSQDICIYCILLSCIFFAFSLKCACTSTHTWTSRQGAVESL